MSRTVRQQFISRGLIKVLLSANGILVREETVYDRTLVYVGPPTVTATEFADALSHHDRAGHLTSIDDENGRKWAINDQGRAWAVQNNL